jgi:hypothetical protein
MLKTASSFANSVGALNYKGTWNASTNTPTLVSGVGTKGDYYVVSVAGTTNLDGTTLWGVGDLAAFNGSIWQKIDGGDTGLFTSITVAGLTGYMYANNNTPVTASTTIPVASVTGAVPNTVNVLASGLLTGGGALTGNVTVGLTSVPVANVPGAVPNTVNVLTSGLLSGGGALTGNVTVSLTSVPFANVTGAGTMASQNANAVAITGGTVDNVVIGGTTPNAATFTTLTANSTSQFGRASANYKQVVGGATGNAVVTSVLGSDANVSAAFVTKGTGALDLAAGSSGVNISNGGTVTALTKTSLGLNYTSPPALAISAPTTAGGVTATATTTLQLGSVTGIVISGGSGYAVGDDFYLVGGTFTTQMRLRVATVSGTAVATVTSVNGGEYTVIPSTPASTTAITGAGSGCTITPIWALGNTITITNAGSGYVEQPTVTFSGGGGSGAAAYATVGSGTTVKSVGSTMSFAVPSGNVLQLQDNGSAVPNYLTIKAAGTSQLFPNTSNSDLLLSGNGTGGIRFNTNSTAQQQMAVTHTASAVNYVQVTGGATGNAATVTASAQGSDSNVNMRLTPKGTGTLLTATAATILDGTAIPAGGTAGAGYKLSSTANFGIFFGSGAPTLSAAKGSLYMRSDGSSIATRMYINTDGSTTWTNVVTAA